MIGTPFTSEVCDKCDCSPCRCDNDKNEIIEEYQKIDKLVQGLESFVPNAKGAFTGTVCERLERIMLAYEQEWNETLNEFKGKLLKMFNQEIIMADNATPGLTEHRESIIEFIDSFKI